MAVDYSLAVINDRLQAVIDNIDAAGGNGSLRLYAGSTLISTISLARPCATIDSGVMTFTGTLLDPAAAASGLVDQGIVYDSSGTLVIHDLTVGIPLGNADITMSNGLNSTYITAGQCVALLSAQITGS